MLQSKLLLLDLWVLLMLANIVYKIHQYRGAVSSLACKPVRSPLPCLAFLYTHRNQTCSNNASTFSYRPFL